MSFKIGFIFFLIILVASIGLVGFWNWREMAFSKEDVRLEILGPREVEMAEKIEYTVKIRNESRISLEDVELIFEYPAHSLPKAGNPIRVTKQLEDIHPGEERSFSFSARLFGKKNETKIAQAFLLFRPKDLQAVFESSTTFTTLIKDIPIVFEFDLPSRIEAPRLLDFSLNYFSNSAWPLLDLGIKIFYPVGFEFLESRPTALEETEWNIGLLNQGQGGRINIKGRLVGEPRETKIFKAQLGQWQEGRFVVLKEIFQGVEIIKPFLHIFQQVNQSPKLIANPGKLLHYEIFFKNLGQTILRDLFLVVRLEGELFDYYTLNPGVGRATEDNRVVIWDHTIMPKLRTLLPLTQGKVEFWITVKDDPVPQIINPTIRNRVSIAGIEQEFENKINSKIKIEQMAFFEDEAFENFGPVPPKVGETTTYTIVWRAKNYYNKVKNVKIRAVLPEQVELTNKIFPEQGFNLTFDSITRELVWNIDSLDPGAPEQVIAFQISFTPDDFQKNQSPEIIGQVKISGEDTWTKQTIKASDDSINTSLPDDPFITEEMGIVQ